MTQTEYLSRRHNETMALWRETRRKYWLNEARRCWRQIESLVVLQPANVGQAEG